MGLLISNTKRLVSTICDSDTSRMFEILTSIEYCFNYLIHQVEVYSNRS